MKKNLLKKCLFIIFLSVLSMIVISIMLKYDVEGEKKLPFSISKILLVSTVDGNEQTDEQNIWNIDVTQVNDLYIYLDKTIDVEQTINQIKVENFVVNKTPSKGKLKVLRPTGELPNLYTYSEQDYINGSITYLGAAIDDMKALEISNNGGVIGFRVALENLGNFISNEKIDVSYDGDLLSNMGVNLEEISFNISFDIIITTSENVNYKGTITLDMPINSVIEEGSSSTEITEFSNIVFKRI